MSFIDHSVKGKAVDSFLDETFNELLADYGGVADPELIYEDGKPPVNIIEFIESSKFLGMKERIYSRVKQILWQVEHGGPEGKGFKETYLELGKGSGKTVTEQIFLTYEIYKTLCLKNPHKTLNHLASQPIVFLHCSISEKQAKAVGFAGTLAFISNCPWFRNKFQPYSTEVRFPKNIQLYCGHSGMNSWLGFPILAASLDEMNFMIDSSHRSVSEGLYRALKGSLITRFPETYKLLLVSSPNLEASYLHRMIKFCQRDGEEFDISQGCQKTWQELTPLEKHRFDLGL